MAFDGQAQVFAPEDNCRFTQYLLRHLIEWQEVTGCGSDVDVVHWNAGLWDILRLADGEPQTPPEHYAYYIDRICRYLKQLYPNAAQIFATSTKVVEARYTGQYKRANADIVAYNEGAEALTAQVCRHIGDALKIEPVLPDFSKLFTKETNIIGL